MDEFDWIETYLAPLAGPEGLKLQDDAALYQPRSSQDLVLTQDSFVEGVHFFEGEYGAGTAERLLAVNLSDLAAKGARPVGYLLSVAWPQHLKDRVLKTWMAGFSKGLATSQSAYGFTLFGGDTVKTKGPMVLTATFIGIVPKGEMVTRSGAKEGDDVWVTGTIGDAHLGLLLAQESKDVLSCEPAGEHIWQWEEAFRYPTPRLLFRKTLRQYATSCADVSDGVLSEASHIAKASQCHLALSLKNIPLSKGSEKWCKFGSKEDRYLDLVTAGDDYELLFTANPKDQEDIKEGAQKIGLKLTRIGNVQKGLGLSCLGLTGVPLELKKIGYTHK